MMKKNVSKYIISILGIFFSNSILMGNGLPEVTFTAECISNWKDATAISLTYDEARNIIFLGSSGCLCVLDAKDPFMPVQIGRCVQDKTCVVCDLHYDNTKKLLYIAAGMFGICVMDVADPTQPKLLGHYDTPGYASGIFALDDYIYVADGDAGLRIIDASIPSKMQELGFFMTTSACGVYVSQHFAYIADLGLRIVDISNPGNPQAVGYCSTPGVAYNLDFVDPLIYLADDWGGLRIIDVSNPSMPQEIGFYDTPGHTWDVKVAGNLAYVADYDTGLRIIDISKPHLAQEIAHFQTSDALSLHLNKEFIFLADLSSGLRIYQMGENVED